METLRIGIIGTGRMGMIHARNFREFVPYAKVVSFCDIAAESCQAACKEFGIQRYYSDYREMLKRDELDAVVVATPVASHCDIVIEAARRKKHILCEKPMAMDGAQCEKMRQAVAEHNIIFLLAFVKRFDKSHRLAKEVIHSGEIGEVVMVKASSRTPGFPKPWQYDVSISNGLLSELSCHDIDAMRWFAGAEFQSVYAIAGNYRSPDVREKFPDYYDTVAVLAEFYNNVQGLMDGAFSVQYGYDSKIEILGTKGCIQIGNIHDDCMVKYTKAGGESRGTVKSWKDVYRDAFIEAAKHFYECVRKGKSPEATAYDGEMALQAVNACYRSLREKSKIKMPI